MRSVKYTVITVIKFNPLTRKIFVEAIPETRNHSPRTI